jgi:hypothetical protein
MEGLFILFILGWLVWKLLSSPVQSLAFIGKGIGLLVLGMGAAMGLFALVMVSMTTSHL